MCALWCGCQGMLPEVPGDEVGEGVVLWLTPLGELAGESLVPVGRAQLTHHASPVTGA